MNQAEGIIHDTETKMEEFKDQLPADEVSGATYFSIYQYRATFFSVAIQINVHFILVICNTSPKMFEMVRRTGVWPLLFLEVWLLAF